LRLAIIYPHKKSATSGAIVQPYPQDTVFPRVAKVFFTRFMRLPYCITLQLSAYYECNQTGDNEMAYKYSKEQALQKAIILDKLIDTLNSRIADADRSLQTPRDAVAQAGVQASRDTSANYLELVELLQRMEFDGEITAKWQVSF
jgi:hypothetical protein